MRLRFSIRVFIFKAWIHFVTIFFITAHFERAQVYRCPRICWNPLDIVPTWRTIIETKTHLAPMAKRSWSMYKMLSSSF